MKYDTNKDLISERELLIDKIVEDIIFRFKDNIKLNGIKSMKFMTSSSYGPFSILRSTEINNNLSDLVNDVVNKLKSKGFTSRSGYPEAGGLVVWIKLNYPRERNFIDDISDYIKNLLELIFGKNVSSKK